MIFAKNKIYPSLEVSRASVFDKSELSKSIGSLSTKRNKNLMGEIELKFNFDTESRGALFAPRQSFICTIFPPEPCEAQQGRRGFQGRSPWLFFFAILWRVPKNCITDLPYKSKFEKPKSTV